MGLSLRVGYAAPIILMLLAGFAVNGVTAENRSSGNNYTYRNRAPAQNNQYTRRTYNYSARRPPYRYQNSPSAYSRYRPNGYPYYSNVPYTYRYGSQAQVVGHRQNDYEANVTGIGGNFPNQGSPGLSVSPAQSQPGPLGQPGYQSPPGYQGQPAQTAFTCKTASLTCSVPQRGYQDFLV